MLQGDLVEDVLVRLLLVLFDNFCTNVLLEERHVLILLQLTTLVCLKLLVALLEHSLLLGESVLREQHLSMQLLFLANCSYLESPIRLRAKQVRGNIREDAISIVDGKVHLGVGSLLGRLGHIVLLEYLVLALAQRRDCQYQPGFIRVVFPDGVDSRWRQPQHLEIVVELLQQDLLAGGRNTLSIDDVVHFEAEDFLGLDADEVVAADKFTIQLR